MDKGKAPPKEALKTQTNCIRKRIRSEEQLKQRLKHKALQKGTLQREFRSAEKKRTTQKKKKM